MLSLLLFILREEKNDVFLEISFFPNDSCGLLKEMSLEDLLGEWYFYEYVIGIVIGEPGLFYTIQERRDIQLNKILC